MTRLSTTVRRGPSGLPRARPATDRRRRLAVVSGLAVAAVVLSGCSGVGAGARESQERDVQDVTAVDLRTSGELTVVQGEETGLTITARPAVLDDLTAEVEDGVLVLGRTPGLRWGSPGRIEYRLVVSAVDTVLVRGSGTAVIAGEGLVVGDRLTLTVEGSGDVRVSEVDVDQVDVRVAGSGDAVLSGRADRTNVSVEGSGSLVASDLVADEAVVSVAGSGSADVHVRELLDAVVRGSGSVRHIGGAEVTADISGSGSVDAG